MHFGCSTQKRNVHCNTDVKRTQNLIEIPPHVLLRLLVHAVRADYHRIPAIKNLLGCLSGAAGSSNRTPARPTNKSTCHCGPARGAMARQGSRCAECSMSPCKWEQAQQAEDMVWSQPEPPSYQWNSPGQRCPKSSLSVQPCPTRLATSTSNYFAGSILGRLGRRFSPVCA